jgi:hypothetical protein
LSPLILLQVVCNSGQSNTVYALGNRDDQTVSLINKGGEEESVNE